MTVRPWWAACLVVSMHVGHADAAPPVPADVARFVERRESCDHFRGEEPYDAARARVIARQARKHCTGTDRALAALKRKYHGNRTVQARLAGYETAVE